MKKILSLLVIGLLVLTGCSQVDQKAENDANKTLDEIVESLYNGISEDEMPAMSTQELTNEDIEYFVGVKDFNFKKAVASEAMIGSIAHSVVVIELEESKDVDTVKENIKLNADPRKWICVEADEVTVESKGNFIILAMTDKNVNDKIIENFLK